MKSSNRFILWFGIGISVLIVLTVALVLATRNTVNVLPENTPEGVVQRFLQAMQDKDYPKAFSYLNVVQNGRQLTYEDWSRYIGPPSRPASRTWKASLGKITTTGNISTVEVMVDIFQPSGPFDNPIQTQTVIFNLGKTNGVWYITQDPPTWWIY